MSLKTPQSGLLEEADGTKNALQFFAAPRKASVRSDPRRQLLYQLGIKTTDQFMSTVIKVGRTEDLFFKKITKGKWEEADGYF